MVQSRRSDAFASVSRILDAARRVFASGDGTGSLDRIAKEAGVGIATLYRHFPNRQALAMAVFNEIFSTEVEPLIAKLGSSHTPRDDMLRLAERIADIAERERGLADSLGNLTQASLDYLQPRASAFEPMVSAAQLAGNMRPDLVADDFPIIITVIINSLPALGPDNRTRRRYLSLLLDALNPNQAQPLPSS